MQKPSFFMRIVGKKSTSDSASSQKTNAFHVSSCEDGFLRVIEGLGDGVLLADPLTLAFKRTNERMTTMLGYTQEELLDLGIKEIHPTESLPLITKLFEQQHLQEPSLSENISVKRKDGSIFFADITASLIQLDGQNYVLEMFRDSTARKEREENWNESREKHLALYENAPQAYHSLDEAGRFIDLNKTWLKMLGYERDEVMGKSFADFLHPDWVTHFESTFAAFKKNGYVHDVQFKLRQKSGRFIDIELNGCISYLPDGSFRKTYCAFQDITQRKHAEEQLKKSEKNYRNLLDNLSSAIITHNSDATILFANSAACTLLGLTEDKIKEQRWTNPQWSFLREDHSVMPAEELPINRIRATGQPVHSLVVGIKQPSSVDLIWVLVNGFIVKDRSGACEQIINSFVDITEHKNALEMLDAERQRLAGILKGTNVGTWEWNVQTGELALNERWANILGYTLDELRPISIDTWTTATYPEDLAESSRLLEQHFSGELDYYEFETRMKHKKGSCVWLLDRGKVVSWTPDHKPLMMMGTHMDVTESHLLHERLQQAEKMDAIGQLAGGVAHDFNNQLSGVLGYADLLQRELTDPKLIEYAQNIVQASRRAAELTAQLLAFGRKGKNMNVPVKVHQVIDEVVSMLERSIDKRIVIKRELNASIPETCGDPTQIYNALLNLGINARDAMPEGGTLTYTTDSISLDLAFITRQRYDIPPGDFIRISVSDSGIGMSKEVQRKIFEPFYTTKEKGKGTGLGLSSVYGTIKNHNGVMHVYSEPGLGSVFRMYLPVAHINTEHVVPVASLPRQGKGRILLVDDEELLRHLGSDILSSFGYQVATSEDGQAAIEYYGEHWQDIDLVILDMMMPRMDGHQAFIAMREINPAILAILSSGYSMNGKAQSILDEGVKAFVGKPFSLRELVKTVERVLNVGHS